MECMIRVLPWRYDFNHSKSGVLTFGETKPHRFESLKNREWKSFTNIRTFMS